MNKRHSQHKTHVADQPYPANNRHTEDNARRLSKVRNHFKVAIPLISLLILTIFGGGLYPLTAMLIATAIAVIGLSISFPAIRRTVKVHWYIGIILIFWLLATILPLPINFLGQQRTEYFRNMHQEISNLVQMHPQKIFSEGQPSASVLKSSGVKSEDKTLWGSISLNRAGSTRFILLFIGAWAMLWLVASMNTKQRAGILKILIIAGTLVAALGLVGNFILDTGHKIWWLIEADNRVGGGPFINRDHFASFCAMLVPLAFSFVIDPLLGVNPHIHNKDIHHKHRKDIGKHTNSERLLQKSVKKEKKNGRSTKKRIFFAICLGILFTATVLSFSRGGMLMMLTATGITAAFWLKGHPALATASTGLAVVIICTFLFWPSSQIQDRVATLRNLDTAMAYRNVMQRNTLEQWKHFPLLGSGSESFRTVNPALRKHAGTKTPLYAHNEYLQVLAENGIIGFLLFVALVVSLIVTAVYNILRNNSNNPAANAIRGTFLHSEELESQKSSFHPSVPPLPMMATACGVAGGVLLHSFADFPCRIPLNAFLAAALLGLIMPVPARPFHSRRRSWWPKNLLLSIIAVILLISWNTNQLTLDKPSRLRRADIADLVESLSYSPTYWLPWLKLSEKCRTKAQQLSKAKQDQNRTVQVNYDPLKLYRFGVNCLDTAAKYNPTDYRLWISLFDAKQQTNSGNVKVLRSIITKAVAQAPQRMQLWKKWINFEKANGSYEDLKKIAEKSRRISSTAISSRIYYDISRSLQKKTEYENAHETITKAVELDEDNFKFWQQRAVIENQLKLYDDAERSLKKATNIKPNSWKSWMKLGRIRLKQKKERKANRAFSEAVKIRPELRKKVDKLWEDAQTSDSHNSTL